MLACRASTIRVLDKGVLSTEIEERDLLDFVLTAKAQEGMESTTLTPRRCMQLHRP